MTETLPEDQRLTEISARAFEHPADRAATAALKSVPALDFVVRKLSELGYERAFRGSLMASSVRNRYFLLLAKCVSALTSFGKQLPP